MEKRRIAVIGAGFAGLALSWYLFHFFPKCQLTVFDEKGVGGGASGVATGLIHPYVGEEGKRSLQGTEALCLTHELIDAVEKQEGPLIISRRIVRSIFTKEQDLLFSSHIDRYGDVQKEGEGRYLISSGVVIDPRRYLEGLWAAIERKGGRLICQQVKEVGDLSSFDAIVLAAGAGISSFPEGEGIKVNRLKGQVLTCRLQSLTPLHEARIGKGYIVPLKDQMTCHVGSTYERRATSMEPNLKEASIKIFDKVSHFFPGIKELQPLSCQAGMRVCRIGHYAPMIGKVTPKVWVLTGLGSRGLLYHAYLGKMGAEAILANDDREIKEPWRLQWKGNFSS